MRLFLSIIALLFVLYTVGWFLLAKILDKQIELALANQSDEITFQGEISKISGFPSAFTITASGILTTPEVKFTGRNILIKFWPLPHVPSEVIAPAGLSITSDDIQEELRTAYAKAKLTTFLTGVDERALRAFRDKGGKLVIDDLVATQQDIQINAQGAFSLDNNMQPQGELRGRIYGFSALVRKLRDYDVIDSDQANMANLASLPLTLKDENNQNYIAFPLFLNNQQLYLGPIFITELPRL